MGKTRLDKLLSLNGVSRKEAAALIRGETIGPFADFRSKGGKPFSASLKLESGKVQFIFPESDAGLDLAAIHEQRPLGASPVDGSPVYETGAAYMSESALNGDAKKGLRISKTILGRRIEPEHISQLLGRERRTALITASVPELTARTFSMPGTSDTSLSANATSSGVAMPKVVPFAARSRNARVTSGWAWPRIIAPQLQQ